MNSVVAEMVVELVEVDIAIEVVELGSVELMDVDCVVDIS